MAAEREIKITQQDRLFDIMMLLNSEQDQMLVRLNEMLERAQSGMTDDEIDAVKERVARALARHKKAGRG